jgi:membrane associated rhomboid family serine protease
MSDAVRTALLLLARLVLLAAIAFVVFVGIVGVVQIFAPDRPGARGGGIVTTILCGALIAGGVWLLRRLPKFSKPFREHSRHETGDAEQRLLTGETVELRPSPWRSVLLLLVSLLLCAACVTGLLASPNVLLVLGALLFGAGIVVSVLRMVPGQMYLRVSPEGLVVRNVFKTARWRWNDIVGFRPYEISLPYGASNKMVGFDRRDVDHRRQGFWKMANRGMSGVDVSLPDTYGLNNAHLAALLQDAHDRYATEYGPNPSDVAIAREVAHIRQDRVPLVTGALTVTCVALFVAEVARYGLFQDGAELYRAGAASRFALSEGRWWTLLAANVLHAGPIHLLVNLVGLVLLGWLLEREVGWAKVALLCLAGALAATGAAVLVQPHTEVVGVSGVIFALLGWAVMRDRLRTRALGAVAWGTLIPGIVYTLLVPYVSIGAHLGGLAAGLVLGGAFEHRESGRMAGEGRGASPARRRLEGDRAADPVGDAIDAR